MQDAPVLIAERVATADPDLRVHHVAALNDQAWELRETDPPRAMDLATRAFTLATQSGNEKGEGDALRSLAFLHVLRGEYGDGVKQAGKAGTIYGRLHDGPGQAMTLSILAQARQSQGDYGEALELLRQAIELANTAADTRLQAMLLEHSADVHNVLNDITSAVSLYRESMTIYEMVTDARGKAGILRKLAFMNRGTDDSRSAMECLKESLEICEQIGYLAGQYKALNNMGLIYQGKNEFVKALECHQRSLDAIRKAGDVRNEATSLTNIGILYRKLGDYAHAAEYHSQSLDIAARIGDQDAKARALNNIANVWYETGEYAMALTFYNQARGIHHELGDHWNEALALRNMGNAHSRKGEFKESLNCLQKSLDVRRGAGDTGNDPALHNDFGDAYAGLGDYATSLEHYRKGEVLAERHGDTRAQANALIGGSTVLLRTGKATEAITHLKIALGIAEELQARKFIVLAHERLADAHEIIGEYEKTVMHLRTAKRVHDQMINEASERTVKSLMAQHEIAALKCDAEFDKQRHETLAKVTEELDYALKENTKLMKHRARLMEIAAHDLRGPLARICLMSSCNPSETPATGDLSDRLAKVNAEGRQVLQIVGNMLSREAIQTGRIDLHFESADLAALAREVVAHHDTRAKQKHIVLDFNHDGSTGTVIADHTALHQVLDNLVANAIKFSPNGKQVRVSVGTDTNVVRCAVADEGPGITKEDQLKLFTEFGRLSTRPTAGEGTTGLGLWIVKALVERMQGRVWCNSEPGNGATFVVELTRG